MDTQFVLTLVKIGIPIVMGLALYNLYLVSKLKNFDLAANWNANKINGIIFVLFFVGGLAASIWGVLNYKELYILITNPASDHGVEIDHLFWITTVIACFVAIVTNAVLFWFAYKYSGGEGKKALYYPENNKLEIAWTVVPAIALTALIFYGMFTWWEVTGPAPDNAIQIELTGKQFEWSIRYPGQDGKLGVVTWDSINDAEGNSYGYHFVSDKNAQDDFNPQEIHLPVGVPVKVNIRARDVLHSATMPHFRMKMDAVPGMATSFWFTPTITTAEMRKTRNNPKFNYELSCQEICGGGHWNMRRVIIVETKEAYEKWMKEQKPTYLAWKEGKSPAPAESAPITAAPKADSVVKAIPGKPEDKPQPAPAAKDAKSTEPKATPAKAAPAKSGKVNP